MAMTSTSSAASQPAFHRCQRNGTRQFCFSPLRFPVSLSTPGRGDVRAFPPDLPAYTASCSSGTGRGVQWAWQPMLAAGFRPVGLPRAAATTNRATSPREGGGGDAPLPPQAVTYSATVSTDLPLHDSPEASFEEYLDDRPRIFAAMFPDRRRCRRLNDEEWRVQMLPMQILFASVNPVVVMRLRCKSQGRGYPPEVPTRVTRLLELRATRWELQGLEGGQVPSHFVLDVQGLLYPDRGEGGPPRSRLRGHLQTSISFVLPPVLALVPENALREVAESVLRTLAKRMKQEVDGSLLTDFQNFRRERLKKHLINERVARYPRVHADPNPKADSQKRTP